MRYSIRRIGLGSALRMSLLLGWVVALCPALCMAGLAMQLLRTLSRALAQVQTLDITVLGQNIATVDPLALLQLRDAAEGLAQRRDRITEVPAQTDVDRAHAAQPYTAWSSSRHAMASARERTPSLRRIDLMCQRTVSTER